MKKLLCLIALAFIATQAQAFNYVINGTVNQSGTYIMQNGDTVYDTYSSNLFQGAWTPANLFWNLSYGETRTHTGCNITAIAPSASPLPDYIEYGMVYGEIVNDTEHNMACFAPDFPVFAFNNHSLAFSQTITDNTRNYSCTAPAFPRVNLNRTLALNETVSNSTFNYSFTCSPNYSNTSINLSFNGTNATQVYNNSLLNLTVSCAFPFISSNITLQPAASYVNSTYGLNVSCANVTTVETKTKTCDDITPENVNLAYNELWKKTVTEECKQYFIQAPAGFDKNKECFNYSSFYEEHLINCTNMVDIKMPDNGNQKICLDNLTSTCTPTEILEGNMLGCIKRNIQTLQESERLANDRALKCDGELSAYKQGDVIIDRFQKNQDDKLTFFAMVVAILLGVGVGVYFFVKQVRVRPQERLPRETNMKEMVDDSVKRLFERVGKEKD